MANRGLTLRVGEYEVGTYFANHVQGNQGYGGRLSITSERLVFIPVAASQANGGSRSEIGGAEYFVVWRPQKLAGFVNGVLHGA
jgi:hypothetical protein